MENYTYSLILILREGRIILTKSSFQEVGPGFKDIPVIFVHSLSFISKQYRNILALEPNNTETACQIGQ